MNFVPEIDVEYVLLRPFRHRLHIITYTRFADDSGILQHGRSAHMWEFNPTVWSDNWNRLRTAGWLTFDDARKTAIIDGALPDCTDCDCQIPDMTEFLDERTKRGVPLDQINREWREYTIPFDKAEQDLLWGIW